MNRRELPAVAASLLLASPVVVGALYSTLAPLGLAGAGANGPTLGAIGTVLRASDTWRGLGWTMATAAVATIAATAAACYVAVRLRTSRAGHVLAILPMGVPHVAAALAALLLLGQSGFFSRITYMLGWTATPGEFPALVYDPAGVSLVVAFAWKEFPFLTLTALAVLLTTSTDLEEAARTLGANSHQTYRRVTWPQLWRGLAPAVLAAFAFLIGQYEMPALLAPSNPLALPLLTYERSVDSMLARRAEAHLGLLALVVSALIVLLHARWRAHVEPEPL